MLQFILLVYYAFDNVMFAQAAMGGGVATTQSEAPTVRKDFPETWIWECQNAGFVFTHILLYIMCAFMLGHGTAPFII